MFDARHEINGNDFCSLNPHRGKKHCIHTDVTPERRVDRCCWCDAREVTELNLPKHGQLCGGTAPMIVHVAGEPVGFVQDCVRCGAVLMDNRGVEVFAPDPSDNGKLAYWRVGANVADYQNGGMGVTPDAPTCSPHPTEGQPR